MRIGALVVGVAFTLLALAVKSAAVFFAGTALSGVGFGSSFQGGIRTVVLESPSMSGPGAVLLFTVSYRGLGVPVVAAGILMVRSPGLIGAAEYYGAAPIVLAVLAPVGAPSRGTERGALMTMSVAGLSIDCADAAALAGFWSEALGRPVNPGADAEHAAIDATDLASGPRLSFQKVPEPKTVKNRLHLDLRTDRFEAESDRLTGLGATAIRSFDRPTIRWITFADPEGNEFDLIAAQAPASGAGH